MKNNISDNNESGFALVTALLILVLLTIIGIAAVNITTTELNIAGNDKKHKIAFYAAESGAEAGRTVLNTLKVADPGFWDLVLDGRQITFNGNNLSTCDPTNDPANCVSLIVPDPGDVVLDAVIDTMGPVAPDGITPIGRRVGPANDFATFTLLVRDNLDLDGNAPGTSNPLVDTDNTLILTSTGTYGTATSTIVTVVRYIGNDDYAQEHYKPSNPNQAGRIGDVAF